MCDLRHFEIETERLHLRCVEPCDAEAVSEVMVPEIACWLASWELPFTHAMAEARIADERMFARKGVMLPLALVEKTSKRFVGWVTIYVNRDNPARAGAGYWVMRDAQGRGYLREIAKPVLSAAFDLWDIDVIEAGAQIENSASFGVMRAWGMKPVAKRMHYAPARGREEPCLYYEITRSDFLKTIMPPK